MATGRLRIPTAIAVALASALLAAGCGGDEEAEEAAKPFQPEASLRAIGGTARTEKPEIVLQVEARPGEANIRSAEMLLPAAFLVDPKALGTICSERELRRNRCAGRERMGFARVTSPLYEGALSGPVYAVSGAGGLPRLAYVLDGPAEILLRGRIEVEGVRIGAGVEDVPDTPLRRFELRLDGGRDGYLILSRDICRFDAAADATFTSHEGQAVEQRLPLAADCG